MEIQEEKVMWIRKIGLGILIGVVLCSVMVNVEERNSRKAEPMTVMERMREIPHKIRRKAGINRLLIFGEMESFV